MAERIDDAVQRAWALAGVARGLAQAGQNERALEVVTAVRSVEAGPSVHRAEGRALWEIARSLAQAGDSEKALALAVRAQELLSTLHSTGNVPVEYAMPELDDFNYSFDPQNLGNNAPLIEVIRITATEGQIDRALEATQTIVSRQNKTLAQGQIVEVLTRAGRLDRALAVTNAIDDPTVRAQALARVAEAMVQEGDDSVAEQIANRALREAQVIDDPWHATWALVAVIDTLAGAGLMEQAIKAAEAISDPEARAWAFVDLGKALARAGDRKRIGEVMSQALEAADHVESQWAPSSRMRSRFVIRPDTEVGQVTTWKRRNVISPGAKRALEAGAVIGSFFIKDQSNVKALMLPEVAQVLARGGETERAAQIIDQIVIQALAADNAKESDNRNLILAQAAGALARLGKAEAARQAAGVINNALRAAPAHAAVAVAFSRTEQEEQAAAEAMQAVAALQPLRGTAEYDDVLAKVVMALTQAGQIEQVLAEGDDVDTIVRALLGQRRALDTVVQVLLRAGDSNRAAEMVDRAIAIASGNPDHLAELIIVLHHAGRHEGVTEIASQAEAAAAALSDPKAKAERFVRLANVYVQVGAGQQAGEAARRAVAAAKTIENLRERSVVQVHTSQILADIGQVDQALAVADEITSLALKTAALFWVRLALNEAGQQKRAVELAYHIADIAETVENPSDRAQSSVTASQALSGVGEGEHAAVELINALLSAGVAGRSVLFRTLQESVDLIASLDGGQTLWQIHESLLEVDSWWSTTL